MECLEWQEKALDRGVAVITRGAGAATGASDRGPWFWLRTARARVRNLQSRARADEVATAHYDLDPALYEAMLDDTMTYTCAHWRDPAESLAEAQRNKLRLICDKLDLRPGETLLDIGCGFGGLAAFAATHYGARVLGITNSVQHHQLATTRYAGALPVEFARMDYRDLPALGRRFDKIASVEMIEAVGPKNYETFMGVAHRCLVRGGRFLVQSFISETDRHVCNEWFDRYIFPNGVSPSLGQLATASRASFGAARHVEDLGEHYPPTLLAWDRNLREAWDRPGIKRYDQRFRRMWHFYLTCLAGVFRARDLRLCQIVYGDGKALG